MHPPEFQIIQDTYGPDSLDDQAEAGRRDAYKQSDPGGVTRTH